MLRKGFEQKESKPVSISFPKEEKAAFFDAVIANDREKVKAYLQAGIAINDNDNVRGETALQIALRYRHFDLFDDLMCCNPDVNLFNFDGTASIHHAVLSGNLHAVKALVEAGADIFRCCFLRGGASPLHLAIYEKFFPIAKFLLETEVVCRKQDPSLLRSRNSGSHTALGVVIGRKNYAFLDLFLVLDPTSLDEIDLATGQTIAHFLMSTRDTSKDKRDREVLLKLIQVAPGLLEKKDRNGLTPLHYAAHFGDKEMVEELVKLGADMSAKTNTGATPTMFASKGNHKEVAEFLLKSFMKGLKEKKSKEAKEAKEAAPAAPAMTFSIDTPPSESLPVFKGPIDLGRVTRKRLLEDILQGPMEQKILYAKWYLRDAILHKQRHVMQCIVESVVNSQPKLIDLNEHFKEVGQYFLDMAVLSGSLFVFEYLLDHGATLKSIPGLIYSPIFLGQYDDGILDHIIKLFPDALLEKRDVKGVTLTPFYVFICTENRKKLSVSRQIDLLEKLLPVKGRGAFLKQALQRVVMDNDQCEIVEWLIRQGADPHQKTRRGLHLFHIAIQHLSHGIARVIFNAMKDKERQALLKESVESSICEALRVLKKYPDLQKKILDILDNIRFSFQNKTGELLHYFNKTRNYDLFRKYINSADVTKDCFAFEDESKRTVPEAILNSLPVVFFQKKCVDVDPKDQEISFQCMEMIYLILDKLSKHLKENILSIKSYKNNLTLLGLARRVKHQALVERLEKTMVASAEHKAKPAESKRTGTGDKLVKEAGKKIKHDPKDKEAAKLLYRAASESRNSKAERWLGHCCRLGLCGEEKDEKKALEHYQTASANGDVVAKCFVAALSDEKTADQCVREIGSIDGLGASFATDKFIFNDNDFYEKSLKKIIKLIGSKDYHAEQKVEFNPNVLELFVSASKKKKKERKPFKVKPGVRLDEILNVLQKEKLKEPNRFISIAFMQQLKNASSDIQLIKMLHNFVVRDRWSLNWRHFSKIIRQLGKFKLFNYADKFYRIVCNTDMLNTYHSSAIIIAASDSNNYQYAKQIFEEIRKKDRKRLVNVHVLSAIIVAATRANHCEDVKCFLEEELKKDRDCVLEDAGALSVAVTAAVESNDYLYAETLFWIAVENNLSDFRLYHAYLDSLIRNKENYPGKEELINQIYKHCNPLKLNGDNTVIDLHDQSYGSAWVGLKKHFDKIQKRMDLTLIVGRGLHSKKNIFPVRQAVIDLCRELKCTWEWSSRPGIIIFSYVPPATAPRFIFPLEVKKLTAEPSTFFPVLRFAPVVEVKEAKEVKVEEIKVAQPVKPSKQQLELAKTRLNALKLLAKLPTDIQLKIIHDFLEKIFPSRDKDTVLVEETFPERIRDQVKEIHHILNQCSTGFSALVGSQVEYLLTNTISEALSCLEEKTDHTSDVDFSIFFGKTYFDKVEERFRNTFYTKLNKNIFIPNLYEASIEGTEYDISVSEQKTFEEAAKNRGLTVSSFLAIPTEHERQYAVYVPDRRYLFDVALRIVRPSENPREWIARFAENKRDASQYIVRFFHVFKKLIKGYRFPEEALEEFMSCFPSLRDAIRHPQVTGHVISHLKKHLANGNAEKFYQVTNAFDAFKIIFPFMTDKVDQEHVMQCLRRVDAFYQSVGRPYLCRIVACFVALNTYEAETESRLKSMKKIINGDPLLAKIFEMTLAHDDFDLRFAISEVDYIRQVSEQVKNTNQNKEVKAVPPLIKDKLLFRAYEKAISFLQKSQEAALLKQARENIKKIQPEFYAPSDKRLWDERESREQFNHANQLFVNGIRLLMLDRHEEAMVTFRKVSEFIIPLPLKYDPVLKEPIDLIDNLSCLFLVFADQPETLQKILQISLEKKPDILMIEVVRVAPPENVVVGLRANSMFPPLESKRSSASLHVAARNIL